MCRCDQDTMNRYLFRKDKVFPNAMKQTLSSENLGLSLYKNHFISYTTIKTMKRLIEAGIPQSSYKFLFEYQLDPQISPPDKNPHVYEFNELSFGFTIWLCACGISACVFVVEILFYFIRLGFSYLAQQIIGLFYFIRLLKQRLRVL